MDWSDVEMELCATGQEGLARWVSDEVTRLRGSPVAVVKAKLDEPKEKKESKRPDTTDMYQFIWYTESGLQLECYLYFHEPDPAAHFYPGADASMELMHALVNGEYDIADTFTYHITQNIEQMALMDATKKNREAREKSAIWRHFQPRDYHSNASFLG